MTIQNANLTMNASFLETTYATERTWVNTVLEACLSDYWAVQTHKNTALQATLPELETLWEALKHATVLGGKRIRPLLALETYRAFYPEQSAERCFETMKGVCCALELIHAQSLVFDDLPCMDDDDLRRGQPTVHKAFDEATAVLVGDALACMSFGCLIRYSPKTIASTILLQCVQELSDISSLQGLVNGQYADMVSEGKPCTPERLSYIHANKTGALLAFSLRAGALVAEASPKALSIISTLGSVLGELFQVVDDYLDVSVSTSQLGKTAGKDLVQEKATYVSVHGLEATKRQVNSLSQQGNLLLKALKTEVATVEVSRLEALVTFLQTRAY
jgi:geranylgeranyl pyrophosphate synthase